MIVLDTSSDAETAGAASALEETLVNILDLSLLVEQAHWRFDGSGSKRIHRFLDDLLAQYAHWHEELNERLGSPSNDRLATLAGDTPLDLLPAGKLRDHDVVAFLDGRFARVAERVRGRLEPADAHDPATRDLLMTVAGGLDRQGWMMRAYLASGAGPSAGRPRSAARQGPSAA